MLSLCLVSCKVQWMSKESGSSSAFGQQLSKRDQLRSLALLCPGYFPFPHLWGDSVSPAYLIGLGACPKSRHFHCPSSAPATVSFKLAYQLHIRLGQTECMLTTMTCDSLVPVGRPVTGHQHKGECQQLFACKV